MLNRSYKSIIFCNAGSAGQFQRLGVCVTVGTLNIVSMGTNGGEREYPEA